jgi:hypothetical protein
LWWVPEQTTAHGVTAFEGPDQAGHFVAVAVMLEPSDFFEDQIKECNAQAARAVDKSDREFWRRLAQRWEELLQAKQRTSPNLDAVRTLRPTRQIFSKRRAA